jgi:anti-sigma-K factor RskA
MNNYLGFNGRIDQTRASGAAMRTKRWRSLQWWRVATAYADVCSRMLTYAHVCSRMLMYADAC